MPAAAELSEALAEEHAAAAGSDLLCRASVSSATLVVAEEAELDADATRDYAEEITSTSYEAPSVSLSPLPLTPLPPSPPPRQEGERRHQGPAASPPHTPTQRIDFNRRDTLSPHVHAGQEGATGAAVTLSGHSESERCLAAPASTALSYDSSSDRAPSPLPPFEPSEAEPVLAEEETTEGQPGSAFSSSSFSSAHVPLRLSSSLRSRRCTLGPVELEAPAIAAAEDGSAGVSEVEGATAPKPQPVIVQAYTPTPFIDASLFSLPAPSAPFIDPSLLSRPVISTHMVTTTNAGSKGIGGTETEQRVGPAAEDMEPAQPQSPAVSPARPSFAASPLLSFPPAAASASPHLPSRTALTSSSSGPTTPRFVRLMRNASASLQSILAEVAEIVPAASSPPPRAASCPLPTVTQDRQDQPEGEPAPSSPPPLSPAPPPTAPALSPDSFSVLPSSPLPQASVDPDFLAASLVSTRATSPTPSPETEAAVAPVAQPLLAQQAAALDSTPEQAAPAQVGSSEPTESLLVEPPPAAQAEEDMPTLEQSVDSPSSLSSPTEIELLTALPSASSPLSLLSAAEADLLAAVGEAALTDTFDFASLCYEHPVMAAGSVGEAVAKDLIASPTKLLPSSLPPPPPVTTPSPRKPNSRGLKMQWRDMPGTHSAHKSKRERDRSLCSIKEIPALGADSEEDYPPSPVPVRALTGEFCAVAPPAVATGEDAGGAGAWQQEKEQPPAVRRSRRRSSSAGVISAFASQDAPPLSPPPPVAAASSSSLFSPSSTSSPRVGSALAGIGDVSSGVVLSPTTGLPSHLSAVQALHRHSGGATATAPALYAFSSSLLASTLPAPTPASAAPLRSILKAPVLPIEIIHTPPPRRSGRREQAQPTVQPTSQVMAKPVAADRATGGRSAGRASLPSRARSLSADAAPMASGVLPSSADAENVLPSASQADKGRQLKKQRTSSTRRSRKALSDVSNRAMGTA